MKRWIYSLICSRRTTVRDVNSVYGPERTIVRESFTNGEDIISGIVRILLAVGLVLAGCNMSQSMRAPALEDLNNEAKKVEASCAGVREKIKGLSSELEQFGQKQKKLMDDELKIKAAYDDLLDKAQRLQQELDAAIGRQRELKAVNDGK